MSRMDQIVADTIAAQHTGAGTNFVVKDNSGNFYLIFIDGAADVVWSKSTDGGITWTDEVSIFAGSATSLSIWYDRWSGIAAGLIHIAYTESGGADTLYRNLDTENSDTLSTQVTIFNGASTAASGALSICRARGGNVYCKTMIDNGVEGGFYRLPNANVNGGAWDAARTDTEALASGDQWALLPGWAADNQDMLCFFWDASANEVSRYIYDDSANTWAETSIATSMNDTAAATDYPGFAVTVDIANSRNVAVAWSDRDHLNADLRCWYFTESAITEVTNVVLNSTDDQSLCSIGIDTTNDVWYAFYCGKSDGSETVNTSLHVYYKTSSDHGTTWGSETVLTTTLRGRKWLATTPRFTNTLTVPPVVAYETLVNGLIYIWANYDNTPASSGGARIIGG